MQWGYLPLAGEWGHHPLAGASGADDDRNRRDRSGGCPHTPRRMVAYPALRKRPGSSVCVRPRTRQSRHSRPRPFPHRTNGRAFQRPVVRTLRSGAPGGARGVRGPGRCGPRRNRPGCQPGGCAPILGAVSAYHVDLRCRWTTAVPGRRSPQDRRPAVGSSTAVGLITMSLGKLSDVSTRIEPMLTKRRAVDLCRIAGCCCCCSC